MSCNLPTENIPRGDSCKTTGGLSVKAFYAHEEDIETHPAPAAAPANYAEAVTATGDFVMKTGKFFREIKGDLEMLGLDTESEGDMNNLSARGKYEFYQSGSNRTLDGFIESNKNKDLVFVVVDADEDQRIIGNNRLPAKMQSFTQSSGKKVSDQKGTGFVVSAPGKIPLYYDGIIPLEPVV